MPTAEATSVPHWTEIDWGAHVHDVEVGGGSIRYADYGQGPALILLHGLGACWQWWLENICGLAAEHRVIAVDIPGFGASDALEPPAEIASQAEAIFALCDALGLETVTPVGHSMGGLVALAMAAAQPARVQRMVLVDAGGVPMTERRLAVVLAALRVTNKLLGLPWVQRAILRRPRVRNLVLGAALKDPRKLSRELARETMQNMSPPGFLDAVAASGRAVRTAAPEKVECPVLLIWGAHDPIVGVRHAEDMRDKLRDARLEVIEGAGHSPAVEDPPRFNRFVLEFAR